MMFYVCEYYDLCVIMMIICANLYDFDVVLYSLKTRVEEKEGVSPDAQRVFLIGKLLPDKVRPRLYPRLCP